MVKPADNREGRAGRYVRQPSGYRAFVPAPLPPDPPLRLTGQLQRLLSEADLALGRLDGSIQILPNPDLFVYMYVRKEAVLSSQIEGTQSSLQDLLAAEAQILSPDRPGDVAEVVNYVAAMKHGLARLAELPVSVRLIREIHERLMRGVRGAHLTPGELRVSQNWIGPAGCTLNSATFVPPAPHEVPDALSRLEAFLHSESELPLLVRIGLAHAQFETIHPFLDGNGRLGRLLIALLLHHGRLLAQPLLYLSLFFKEHRSVYYDLLDRVRTTGDWEAWVDFFLEGVETTAHSAVQTARRLVDLFEADTRRTAQSGRAAANALRVLAALRERPVLTLSLLCRQHQMSFPTAGKAMQNLVSIGIARELTGQRRNRVFVYDAYLGILNEGGQPL